MKSLWLEGENFDVSPNLEPMEPIFHRLALGFCVMGNTNSMFCVGGDANLGVFRYQHVGTQGENCSQRKRFGIAVEYRLKFCSFLFKLQIDSC